MDDNKKRNIEQNKILNKAEKTSSTLLNKALMYSIENIKKEAQNKKRGNS